MAQGLTVTVDTREFDRVFKEYMNYSKRSFTEACNQHAYYIARDAVLLTKGADKSEIRSTLEGSSNTYPEVPLAAILVNTQLGRQGKKGLRGQQMVTAVEKYIKKVQSHINYVKSGWLPAVKILGLIVPKKGGSRIPRGTDKAGRDFGGASPAMANFSPIASIWSSILPKKGMTPKLMRIMMDGAQAAIKMETQSMRKYIENKQNEICRKIWK